MLDSAKRQHGRQHQEYETLSHTVLQRRGRGEIKMEVGRGFNLKVQWLCRLG
jgi:hypothetical protein